MQKKQKNTAAIISFFLGGLGVHKFYLGNWTAGFFYLIFFWTYIPAILGIIEAIMIYRMDDKAFDEKYNQLEATVSAKKPEALTKEPENMKDVIAGIKATWNDPESRKKILKKAIRKTIIKM